MNWNPSIMNLRTRIKKSLEETESRTNEEHARARSAPGGSRSTKGQQSAQQRPKSATSDKSILTKINQKKKSKTRASTVLDLPHRPGSGKVIPPPPQTQNKRKKVQFQILSIGQHMLKSFLDRQNGGLDINTDENVFITLAQEGQIHAPTKGDKHHTLIGNCFRPDMWDNADAWKSVDVIDVDDLDGKNSFQYELEGDVENLFSKEGGGTVEYDGDITVDGNTYPDAGVLKFILHADHIIISGNGSNKHGCYVISGDALSTGKVSFTRTPVSKIGWPNGPPKLKQRVYAIWHGVYSDFHPGVITSVQGDGKYVAVRYLDNDKDDELSTEFVMSREDGIKHLGFDIRELTEHENAFHNRELTLDPPDVGMQVDAKFGKGVIIDVAPYQVQGRKATFTLVVKCGEEECKGILYPWHVKLKVDGNNQIMRASEVLAAKRELNGNAKRGIPMVDKEEVGVLDVEDVEILDQKEREMKRADDKIPEQLIVAKKEYDEEHKNVKDKMNNLIRDAAMSCPFGFTKQGLWDIFIDEANVLFQSGKTRSGAERRDIDEKIDVLIEEKETAIGKAKEAIEAFAKEHHTDSVEETTKKIESMILGK